VRTVYPKKSRRNVVGALVGEAR